MQLQVNNFLFLIQTLHYIPDIRRCLLKYFKFLQDDFSNYTDIIHFIYTLQPYFWVILDKDENFMGFVYLDNFVGNGEITYSAEITTCLDKKAWGYFARYSANIFLKKCFEETTLQKIKAQVYPDNFRVKNFLNDIGFVYEARLKNETLRDNKPQDLDIYGLYRNYYI